MATPVKGGYPTQTLLDIPTGKVCKLCGHKRSYSSYVWKDNVGNVGVSPRCEQCRSRGKRRAPGLPALRYRATKHAVDRYMQRCRPELLELERTQGIVQARLEMRVLMATAPWSFKWPDWYSNRWHGAKDPPGFLMIAPQVIFVLAQKRWAPLGQKVIATVLTGPTPDLETLKAHVGKSGLENLFSASRSDHPEDLHSKKTEFSAAHENGFSGAVSSSGGEYGHG